MSEAEGGGPHERTVGPLLPCPFCGAREGYKLRNGSTYRWWIVACAACGDEIGECRSRGNRQAPADIGRDEVADEHWNRLAARAESLRAEGEEMKRTLRAVEQWDAAADNERDAGKPVLHDMPIALWHQIQKHLTPNASFSGAASAAPRQRCPLEALVRPADER